MSQPSVPRRPILAVLCDDRMRRHDGIIESVWGFGGDYWERYRGAFDSVKIMARVEEAHAPDPVAEPVCGPGVGVHALPAFRGPRELAPRLIAVRRAIGRGMAGADALLVRWPSTLTLAALPVIVRAGLPLAVETVGDPIAAVRHGGAGIAAPLLALATARAQRRLFAAACAVTYVTDSYLQTICPARRGALSGACSDVMLSAQDLRPARQAETFGGRGARLLFAGSLEQPYKGLATLLQALALPPLDRPDITLTIAGGGRLSAQYRARAASLGLADRTDFVGQLTRAEILEQMDRCDLFILPSHTEGMPRTVIEAMARAAPVVASAVGGVPELLSPEVLVPPGDPDAFASRIAALLASPDRLARLSARNARAAQRFCTSEVTARRDAFYAAFADLVIAQRGASNRKGISGLSGGTRQWSGSA